MVSSIRQAGHTGSTQTVGSATRFPFNKVFPVSGPVTARAAGERRLIGVSVADGIAELYQLLTAFPRVAKLREAAVPEQLHLPAGVAEVPHTPHLLGELHVSGGLEVGY